MAYWYNAGTISVTNGNTTVIGSSTEFVANLRTGDGLLAPDGRLYLIQNIASDTQLSIARGYVGATVSGSSEWWGVPVQGYSRNLADRVQTLITDATQALDEIAQFQQQLAQLSSTVDGLDADAVGADPAGAAASTMNAHTSASDPHSQYLGKSAASNLYAALAGGSGANFQAMPQVADKLISEAGTGSNGGWVRLSVGVQCCWATVRLSYSSAWIIAADWTFPQAFSSVPNIAATLIFDGNDKFAPGDSGLSMVACRAPKSKLNGRVTVTKSIQGPDFAAGDYIDANVIAIGPWAPA